MSENSTMQRATAQLDSTNKPADALLDVANAATLEGLIAPAEEKQINALGAFREITPEALNQALANGPAAERALEWLGGLLYPSDAIELRGVNPAGGGAVSYCGLLHDNAQRVEMLKFIRAYNGIWNIYFGLNPRRVGMVGTTQSGNAADVAARQIMFLDLDDKDAPDVDPDWSQTMEELRALGPVGIVKSGNGSHVHLPFERIEGVDAVQAATRPLGQAMALLGADNMSDPARIARLPYTVNLPSASKRKRGNLPVLALPMKLNRPASVPRSLADVCNAVKAVAERLSLPGRGAQGKTPSAAPASNVADFAPRPAPSLGALSLALDEMPNTDTSPLDDYSNWTSFAYAFIGAAALAGFEDEGRALFLDWSLKHPRSDAAKDAEMVASIPKNTRVGWRQVIGWLTRVNPEGAKRVHGELAREAFAAARLNEEDKAQIVSLDRWAAKCANNNAPSNRKVSASAKEKLANLALTPSGVPQPSALPPREWLCGLMLIRGFPTMVVAPGGTGKSGWMMAMAVAMACGKELIAGEKPHDALRVWSHTAEDPKAEQERRLAAVCKYYGITNADLGQRLFLTSARDTPLCFAQMGPNGPEIVQEAVDAVVRNMKSNNVDVFIVDPVAGTSTLPENDNTAINVLMDAYREIAERAGVSVVLVHHTSKAASLNMSAAGVTAARGADAFQAASRVVVQLERMRVEEARKFGVSESERPSYFRILNGKANMAPIQDAKWRRLVSVPLNNGTAEYPAGDTVAVIADWTPPGPVAVTASDLHLVQNAIANAHDKPRADNRAAHWVGWLIADTLGVDVGRGVKAADRNPEQARNYRAVTDMLAVWLADGGLQIVDVRDPKGNRIVQCIAVGELAIMQDGNGTKKAA